jgi:multiple sugar transport system substrate-binding protein
MKRAFLFLMCLTLIFAFGTAAVAEGNKEAGAKGGEEPLGMFLQNNLAERLGAEDYTLPDGWEEATAGVDELVVYNGGGISGDIATKMNGVAFENLTGIKINFIGVPPTNSSAKAMSVMVAKNPDVHLLYADHSFKDLSMFVASGWAEPQDMLWADDIMDYYSNMVQVMHSDGHWWASPQVTLSYTIFYRKSWLENAGVDVPESYDELYQAAKAVGEWAQDEMGSGHYGVTFAGGSHTAFSLCWWPVLYSMGGDIYNPEDGTFDLTNLKAKATYEYFINFIKEGIASRDTLSYDIFDAARAFGTGHAGFILAEPTSYTQKWETEWEEVIGDWDMLGPLEWKKGASGSKPTGLTTLTGGIVNPYASRAHKQAGMLYLDYLRSKEAQRRELVVEGNETYYTSLYDDPDVAKKIDWDFADEVAEMIGLPKQNRVDSIVKEQTRRDLVAATSNTMYPPTVYQMLHAVLEAVGKASIGEITLSEAWENLDTAADSVAPMK